MEFNQDILSTAAYLLLMFLYGITFVFWLHTSKMLKQVPKWTILVIIVYIGIAKNQDFWHGVNLFNEWFIIHPAICFLLLMNLRGVMIYSSPSYSQNCSSIKEMFSGNPCKLTVSDKRKIVDEQNKNPYAFILRLTAFVFASIIFVKVFSYVDDSLDQKTVDRVLAKNEQLISAIHILIKEKDSVQMQADQAVKNEKDISTALVKQMLRDSMNIEIKVVKDE